MGESWKAVLSLILILGGIAAAIAWTHDRPDETVWVFRIGGPLLAFLSLAFLLKLQFRADEVPDYLIGGGEYFNRAGFCFSFAPTVVDGVCWIEAHFQNQRDRPCVGRIALRPARGFFLTRAAVETIVWEVECGPAAFGVARVPIPVRRELQGKPQKFEAGASVRYPQGRGRRLRFRDGIFLRSNARFGDAFTTALTLAGVFSGSVVMSRPATATLPLPIDIAEEVPPTLRPEIATLWTLGDPPLAAEQPLADPSGRG